MKEISTIGLDIAKTVFQLHGVDETGTVTVCRRVRRGQLLRYFAKLRPCLVGMEACATAHYWARELSALGAYGALDPAKLCQSLCPSEQERCGGCGGDL